jgi:hypothetical protein
VIVVLRIMAEYSRVNDYGYFAMYRCTIHYNVVFGILYLSTWSFGWFFIFSLLQIFKFATCFRRTGHVHVYKHSGRPHGRVNWIKKKRTHPRLHHTKTREKILSPETVNTKNVYGGTVPTQERTRGSSNYLKGSRNQIIHLKMVSLAETCKRQICPCA